MNRCSCAPPHNPLGRANAEAGELWQCPLCDRWWRAAVTYDSIGEIVDNLAWVKIPRKHVAYYLGEAA